MVARGAEERARFAASLAELPSNFIGQRAPLELAFSAKCIPHPEKLAKGGEDGFYACPASQSFGVADGVGGWASQGVDPGEFSRSVLQHAYQGIRAQSQNTPRKGAELRDTLLRAVDGVLARRLVGGTTVLLGQLNGSELSVLNFGDSGLIVLRPALRQYGGRPVFLPRIVFRTFDQTHYFNCPYQVSSNSAVMEPPDLVHVSVEAGDLIVAGSDGVFDNLFDHEIQGLASQCLGKPWMEGGHDMGPLLEKFAATVAEEAQRNGKRTGGDPVPFGVSASREGLRFSGGKLDDTTVVAAMVVPKSSGNAADLCGPVPKLHNFKLF